MPRISRRKMFCKFNHALATLLATAMFLAANSHSVKAAEKWWMVADDDWSIGANWGGTVPTSSDDACIGNGGTLNITPQGGWHWCNHLYVGKSGDGYVAFTDGAGLSAAYEYIGTSGVGKFVQTGGDNHCSQLLYIRSEYGSSGTYDLSGTGRLWAVNEFIGDIGIGHVQTVRGIDFRFQHLSRLQHQWQRDIHSKRRRTIQ